MQKQLEMDLGIQRETRPDRKKRRRKRKRRASIDARFSQFHRENPHVYAALLDIVTRARQQGYQRWSMKGVFEVLRWEWSISTTDPDFKLNNIYTSRYARLLMQKHPELEDFFETRRIG